MLIYKVTSFIFLIKTFSNNKVSVQLPIEIRLKNFPYIYFRIGKSYF